MTSDADFRPFFPPRKHVISSVISCRLTPAPRQFGSSRRDGTAIPLRLLVAGGGSTPRATSWPHIRRHAFPFHPIGCRGHDGCADTFSVGVVEMWALVVALVIDIALAWFISGAAYDEGRDLKTWFWI